MRTRWDIIAGVLIGLAVIPVMLLGHSALQSRSRDAPPATGPGSHATQPSGRAAAAPWRTDAVFFYYGLLALLPTVGVALLLFGLRDVLKKLAPDTPGQVDHEEQILAELESLHKAGRHEAVEMRLSRLDELIVTLQELAGRAQRLLERAREIRSQH